MKDIRSPFISGPLERQFNTRGGLTLSLDEGIVAVQDLGDFAGNSPFQYARRRRAVDTITSTAAGAGTNSGVFITPAPGTLLVVEDLFSADAAAVTLQLKLFRATERAAVTVSAANQVIARTDGRIRPGGTVEQISGTFSIFNHTTLTIGGAIGFWRADALWSNRYPVRRYIAILDGTDPATEAPVSLAIMNNSANATFSIGFSLCEYPVLE